VLTVAKIPHAAMGHEPNLVVSNHWTGLLDWNTGMDYWTDIFLVFKYIVVVVVSLIESFWLGL